MQNIPHTQSEREMHSAKRTTKGLLSETMQYNTLYNTV